MSNKVQLPSKCVNITHITYDRSSVIFQSFIFIFNLRWLELFFSRHKINVSCEIIDKKNIEL